MTSDIFLNKGHELRHSPYLAKLLFVRFGSISGHHAWLITSSLVLGAIR